MTCRNVSKACKVIGYSREQCHEIGRNFWTYGGDRLLGRIPGAHSPHPNRVAAEVEQAILEHSLAHPATVPCASLPGANALG